jgi:hypothetical protein
LSISNRGWSTIDTWRNYSIRLHRHGSFQSSSKGDSLEEGQVYDKEKYREMLLEAAETVLGYFGFDRTLYGDTGHKTESGGIS